MTCTGINSTCSIQVFSTSGWVACTSVNILPSPCVNCTPGNTSIHKKEKKRKQNKEEKDSEEKEKRREKLSYPLLLLLPFN